MELGVVGRGGSVVEVAIQEMDATSFGQQPSNETESHSQRMAAQALLHLSALPGSDAGYSLTFLFIRQATKAKIGLLH